MARQTCRAQRLQRFLVALRQWATDHGQMDLVILEEGVDELRRMAGQRCGTLGIPLHAVRDFQEWIASWPFTSQGTASLLRWDPDYRSARARGQPKGLHGYIMTYCMQHAWSDFQRERRVPPEVVPCKPETSEPLHASVSAGSFLGCLRRMASKAGRGELKHAIVLLRHFERFLDTRARHPGLDLSLEGGVVERATGWVFDELARAISELLASAREARRERRKLPEGIGRRGDLDWVYIRGMLFDQHPMSCENVRQMYSRFMRKLREQWDPGSSGH